MESLTASCATPLLLNASRRALAPAEAHGWSSATLTGVLRGLKLVLAEHDADDLVRLSAVRTRLRPHRHCSAIRVADVLADLELLTDDTIAPI